MLSFHVNLAYKPVISELTQAVKTIISQFLTYPFSFATLSIQNVIRPGYGVSRGATQQMLFLSLPSGTNAAMILISHPILQLVKNVGFLLSFCFGIYFAALEERPMYSNVIFHSSQTLMTSGSHPALFSICKNANDPYILNRRNAKMNSLGIIFKCNVLFKWPVQISPSPPSPAPDSLSRLFWIVSQHFSAKTYKVPKDITYDCPCMRLPEMLCQLNKLIFSLKRFSRLFSPQVLNIIANSNFLPPISFVQLFQISSELMKNW